MASVSVCMIVKNEEVMLPRCLESVKWADEIIVVDTGSEDGTVGIAERYGARVYHHKWENNFSLHRNQSIGYATGEWVLIIDADEELVGFDGVAFKRRLDAVPKEVSALVVTISEMSNGREATQWIGMRFFRKSSGIRYENAVHNKAVFDGWSAGTDVVMRHYGYSLDPEKMAAKRKRTKALLEERIGRDPKDVAALYYCTQMAIGERKFDEAYGYGMRFFESVTAPVSEWQYFGVMYFWMAWAALHMGDGNSAYSWATKGLEFWPDDLDLNYIMARIGYQAAMDSVAKKHGRRYLSILHKTKQPVQMKKFCNVVVSPSNFNRTVYTANDEAEQDVKKFLEAAE